MTQIRCGSLNDMKNKAGVRFRGRVELEGRLNDMLVLRDHPRARGDDGELKENAPAFEIFKEKNAREISVGAAWLKHADDKGDGKEFDFLSLTIDNVTWNRPVYLTAFPPSKENDSSWDVVWSRPRGTRAMDEERPSREFEDAA